MLKKYDKLVECMATIRHLKNKYNLEIIDTHVHPLDVMGVLHITDYNFSYNKKESRLNQQVSNKEIHYGFYDYKQAGMLERLKYGRIANLLSQLYCIFFPKEVFNHIRRVYQNIYPEQLLAEMAYACVDKSVLVPVEPWSQVEWIHKYFLSENFLFLQSIDIHQINVEEIKGIIERSVKDYNIIGVKLHPNLQNFYPQPNQNPPLVGEKLRRIYEVVANNKLYLLFHGGMSFFPPLMNQKFNIKERSIYKALLRNFYDPVWGNSEILGQYEIPIIIAHLGHYGALKLDTNLLRIITQRYKEVFFDTAGISSSLLNKAIMAIGSKRLIFGSDAVYNRIQYNLLFLYLAARRSTTHERLEDILLNILGRNFISLIH